MTHAGRPFNNYRVSFIRETQENVVTIAIDSISGILIWSKITKYLLLLAFTI